MKIFRQVALSALVTMGAFGAVLYTGCKAEKCGTAVCQNGSTCINNVCVCPTGYSGPGCGNTWSSEYVGTYDCTQVCKPANAAGTWKSLVYVDLADYGASTIIITNFGNDESLTMYATIDSANHVTIVTPPGTTGVDASGIYATSATYPNGYITFTYSTAFGQGAANYTCTMTMVKE